MKIQLKRSNQLDGGEAKKPSADQMEYGELAVNYNANDPVIFLKDSNNQIISININNIGSIDSGSMPPNTDNNIGDLFFDISNNQLLFWNGTSWVPLNANLGYNRAPAKGTVTNTAGTDADIPLADNVYAGLLSPEQYTKLLNLVGVVLDSPSNGLKLTNDKLSANIATTSSLGTVKIGSGLDVTADGEISVTIDQDFLTSVNLGYTQDSDHNIITNSAGTDARIELANTIYAGLMSPEEHNFIASLSGETFLTEININYQKNGNSGGTLSAADGSETTIPLATFSEAGLMTGVEKSDLFTLVNNSSGGGLTVVNLGYSEASDQGTVTCSAGDNAVIPPVSELRAGLMIPSDYNLLYALGNSALSQVNLGYLEATNGGTVTCSAGNNSFIPTVTDINAGLMTGLQKQSLDFLMNQPVVSGVAPISVTNNEVSLNYGNGLLLNGSTLEAEGVTVLTPQFQRVPTGGGKTFIADSVQENIDLPETATISFTIPPEANRLLVFFNFRLTHMANQKPGSYGSQIMNISRYNGTCMWEASGRDIESLSSPTLQAGCSMGGTLTHDTTDTGAGGDMFNYRNNYWASRIDEFKINTDTNDVSFELSVEGVRCNKCQIEYLAGTRIAVIPFIVEEV